MKHTPGPWYMEANEAELYYEVNGEMQKMIAIGTAKDESPILAYVPTTWDEDKANARLIAAAPELLEACKGVMDMLDGEFPGHPMSERVRKAIAKAEKGE